MIVSKFVEPIVQNPYRGKLIKSGGMREEDDFSCLLGHFNDRYGNKMLTHRKSWSGGLVVEIHSSRDDNGDEIENCSMESFELTQDDAYELALTLLNFSRGDT